MKGRIAKDETFAGRICRGGGEWGGDDKKTTKTTTTESKSSLPGIGAPANDFKEFYEVAADGGQRRANRNVPLGLCGDSDFGSLGKTPLLFPLAEKKTKQKLNKTKYSHKSDISDFAVFAECSAAHQGPIHK